MPNNSNPVAVIPMLDLSGSMATAMGIVKIDAKAFIRSALAGDQIGVIAFADTSSIIYSDHGRLATVSDSLVETGAAADAIEKLGIGGFTNMGQAIQQGYQLMGNARPGYRQAFVLLSDGMANEGPAPDTVLNATPPIFVAGLGEYATIDNYTTLLAKNPRSQYYHAPNAFDMAQVFNNIRAQAAHAASPANKAVVYSGSDSQIQPYTLAGDCDQAQVNVVWSDAAYHYTRGDPNGFAVNVILIDPSGRDSQLQPAVTGAGYVIFNIANPQPGTWNALVQYSVPRPVWGTTGGFEFGTQVNLATTAPRTIAAGAPLTLSTSVVDEGQPVENLVVRAEVTRPSISIHNALQKYADELRRVQPDPEMIADGVNDLRARLHSYRQAQLGTVGDILRRVPSSHTLDPQPDGTHVLTFDNTAQAGSYNVRLTVEGRNPATRKSFSRTEGLSVLVG